MVSITLSVPEEIRKKMTYFDEVNWSGFIRKCIIKKTEELDWKEGLLQRFLKERELITSSVKAQRIVRKKRLEELRIQGLV